METLREILEIFGQTLLFIAAVLIAYAPTTAVAYIAIERESWLLGLLAFVILALTVSIAVYISEHFGG